MFALVRWLFEPFQVRRENFCGRIPNDIAPHVVELAWQCDAGECPQRVLTTRLSVYHRVPLSVAFPEEHVPSILTKEALAAMQKAQGSAHPFPFQRTFHGSRPRDETACARLLDSNSIVP